MQQNNDSSTMYLNHHVALEQLRNFGTFWIGPDIGLDWKVTVPAQGRISGAQLLLHRDALPPIDINARSLVLLNWSTRSFLAQSGIEPFFYPGLLDPKLIKKLDNGETILVPIDIVNYGQRAVEINTALMRFFWTDFSKKLEGDALRNIIGRELIIEGKQGIQWDYGNLDFEDDLAYLAQDYTREKSAISIQLPLNSTKLYIPSFSSAVQITSRTQLPTVLTEIPEGLKLPFVIGETTHVQLGQNIIGVINTGGYDGGGRHIRSPLIDGGFNGKIRTEILHNLHCIELFIYKNNSI